VGFCVWRGDGEGDAGMEGVAGGWCLCGADRRSYIPAKERSAVREWRACGGMGQSLIEVTKGAVMNERIMEGIVASAMTGWC
jgi:hypothetical protein